MKHVFLVTIALSLSLSLVSCIQQQAAPSSDVTIGGIVDEKNRPKTVEDEMLAVQEKEKERQERDLQDVKRQEYYDEKYRRYLNDKK